MRWGRRVGTHTRLCLPTNGIQSVRWSIGQLTSIVANGQVGPILISFYLVLPSRNLHKHTFLMAHEWPFHPEHGMQSTPGAQLRLTSNLQPNCMFCYGWYLANKVLADFDRPTHDPRPWFSLTRKTADHHAAVHSRYSAHRAGATRMDE